ncbi:MAG: PAS domain-containing protein [Verrucomicrobiia bacterium]|jgi:PAS domain S-box-containing protein
MNVIDCNENLLSASAPPGGKEQPAEGQENSDVEKINAQLERENARLAQDNVRLEQKYELLRTLIDSLPDNIFVKNRQSRFLVNNLAHIQTLGATHQDELLGKSDLDIFPAELAGQYYEDDQMMMQSGQPLTREEHVVNPRTGEKHWLLTTKVPMRDKQGAIVGLLGISRDFTPMKRVEEALNRERHLLRTLIDNLPDGIYIKDTEGRKTMANPADLKILGCKTEAEAIGKSDFDFFPKELAEKFWADDQKVIHGVPIINREEYVLNEAGEKRWLLTSKLPLRDQSGKITGLVGISRDITEQKRTEEALRQSRDELEKRINERTAEISQERLLLRTLIDNLPDAVYAKDINGRKTMANPADLKNLKCKTEAEAIGKSDFDLFPKEEAERFWADDQRVLQGQPVLKREESFLDEKGQKHWLLTSKVPICDQNGKITGLVGIGRDITKGKLAEEALAHERSLLRTLIDNLPDAVYAKDTAGRKLLVNTADLKNLHFKTEAEVINKTDFDFFPKDLAEKFWADDQKVIQGEPVIDREEYVFTDTGEKRWLCTSKLPLRDQNGKIVGLVGIGRDITARKLAEDALRSSEAKLRQSTIQLERSNHELQDFAYVASHDLQEPLRKIVVFGERLKEKKIEDLGPEAKDYLERMQKAAARMQTLISDLLTFSRVTTKARPFAPVNLAEVAADVVNDLEGRIEQVKGRVEVVGTLPVIDAEALQMRQLLQNLMGNALKFRRPEETPVVKVEAQIVTGVSGPGTPPQQLCKLMVSDNGIGFDEKYLDRIFNVFQRLHTRNEYEGTGMGLAITKKIALYHGGEITAKSTPGHGATFIVTLPVSHPKPDQKE